MMRNLSDSFHIVWNLTDLLQSFELENTTTPGINYSTNSTIFPNFSVSINNNSNGASDASQSTDLPWWANTIWSIVFGLLIAVAVGGNLIVIWIVLAHRRMWTVTNYFLVNLSISDLMLATLNCSFNFVYMIRNDWAYGDVYCRISNFVANVTVAASVFTLTATSFDRYVAIVTPLKPRMSRCTALIVIGIIWASSCALALPCLLYSITLPYKRGDLDHTACIMLWPDGFSHGSLTDYVYNLIFLTVTYLIPMLAMAVCYSIIARTLWGETQIGELNQRHVQTLRSKRKVVKMFIVMVVLFALAWLPYHLYFIYVYHDLRIASYRYIQHIYLAFYWLAMSGAAVNPLIYYFLNERFRNYFLTLVSCMISTEEKRNMVGNDIPLRITTGNNSHATAVRNVTTTRTNRFSTANHPNLDDIATIG